MEAVLSIAGSDSSGGAGIQADIKTIAAHRLFAETAITALTAQNTLGVTGVLDVDPAFVAKQIDAVFEDIRPAAVKVGMVSSAAIIEAVADALERHAAANIVVDPVMVATSGARLIGDDAIEALKARLLPLADVVTPNMPEAAVLAGFEVVDETSMERAALRLAEAGTGAALVKGGHRHDRADDVLVIAMIAPTTCWSRRRAMSCGCARRASTPRTPTARGCTLSSAIACGLAQGRSVEEAVRSAKGYVHGALSAGLNLGKGSGPSTTCGSIRFRRPSGRRNMPMLRPPMAPDLAAMPRARVPRYASPSPSPRSRAPWPPSLTYYADLRARFALSAKLRSVTARTRTSRP